MKIEMSGAKLYTYDEMMLLRHMARLDTLRDIIRNLNVSISSQLTIERKEIAYWEKQVEQDQSGAEKDRKGD